MVITSPIKPSSMRMIRLKKDPNPPPPSKIPAQEKENTLTTTVDTTPNNKTKSPAAATPLMNRMSSSLLNRLTSCSTPTTAAMSSSSSDSDDMMMMTTMPPVDILHDEDELGSMQVVLSSSPTKHTDIAMIASCSNNGGGRMSKLFKKSGSSSSTSTTTGGGGGDSNDNSAGGRENNNQGDSNHNNDSNHTNGSGDDNNNDKNTNNKKGDANDSGKDKDNNAGNDEDEEEEDNNKTNNNNNNVQTNSQPQSSTNINPTCPSSTTIFNTARIQFAQSSTLPIHTSTESTAPTTHPSWTPVDGTEFKVRSGPNYPKNGKKIHSEPSLYEVYAVRFFRSEKRTVGGATRIMPLPEITPPRRRTDKNKEKQMNVRAVLSGNPFKPLASTTRSGDGILEGLNESVATTSLEEDTNMMALLPGGNKSHPELKGTKIPDVLVVHFMLPYEPPNMFKQKDDGKGGECVYYLRPSQRFLDEISGKIPETPATKLFVQWCNTCESDIQMRSRFKCMALVRDIEKHNMGLLKSYNGKPVLITESGRAASGYHGDIRYLEMTANVHYWAFMAKKGFVSLIPKFKSMQMEVGFTIEAHKDSEMPECMLGSTVLSYIGDKTGPVIDAEMQEPVHEHQS
ncbi:hypothetical protein ACHAWT_009237 [Skeletonema menzelii]